MIESNHLENEPARIVALHSLGILDTPPERRFDNITRLAARLFHVPIVLVSLVDTDRQWFKSCIGLSVRETPRARSFCSHAILQDATMVVNDATLDPRFADLPMVTGAPFIRFYAGQPLKAPNGEKVGTLCLIDRTPRSFDAADCEALGELAQMVETELAAAEQNETMVRLNATTSELVSAQKLLQDQQMVLRAVLDSVGAGIVALDETGQVLFKNQQASDLVGLPANLSLTEGIERGLVTMRTADGARTLAIDELIPRRVARGEIVTADEVTVVTSDGKTRVIFGSGRPLVDADGKRRGAVFAMHDISDRKRAETDLRESENRFRLLSEAAFEGISISEKGVILESNQAMAHMLGYDDPQELVGKAAASISAPECLAAVLANIAAGHEKPYEAIVVRKDGSRVDVEVIGRMYPYQGRTLRVAAFRDITERKRLQRMKDEFVAIVGHDLRNPLGSLSLSLGALAQDVLPALVGDEKLDAAHMLEIAQRSVHRLIRLTDDLLDSERLLAGVLPLVRVESRIDALFADALGTLSGQAREAGVTLVGSPTPLAVWGDRDRLVQVLVNLVGNAIKFSPTGGTVTLVATSDAEAVRLMVSDEGRGIPKAKLESIFERFAQVDETDASLKGGAGLGLAICRSIVEQHGGRIWAQSEPGQGSTFTLNLPLRRVERPQ